MFLALLLALAAPAHAAPPAPIAEATAATDATAAWASTLRDRRARGIAALEAYAARGVFPVPANTVGFSHQFVDAAGHRCAVAELVFTSGRADLVRDTQRTQNDVVLATLTDGPLVDWMLTSGFTREEIAIIQEPGWRGQVEVLAPIDNDVAEVTRVQAHLAAVLQVLRVDTEKSLVKALDRLGPRAQGPVS